MEDPKKKYRTVVVTPLGEIIGVKQEMTALEYEDRVRLYMDVQLFKQFHMKAMQGWAVSDVFIPGDMMKKSFIRLENAD